MSVGRVILILFFGLIAYSSTQIWNDEAERKILIESDGKGYYAYLPAVFIFHDLQLCFIDYYEYKYYPGAAHVEYFLETGTGRVNKYWSGVALLMLPFFLIAHLLALMGLSEPDGYSAVYRILLGIGAISYLCAGLYLLAKLMAKLGLKKWAIIASVLMITLASNLLYYSLFQVSMSHVYSFFVVSAFLFFSYRDIQERKVSWAMSVAFGAILLIRPTNGLVVLMLPFLAGSWGNFQSWVQAVLSKPLRLMMRAIPGLAIVSIQPLIFFIQCGKPFVDSYAGEWFIFSDPQLYNVLFSPQKGLFFYAPALVFSIAGIIPLARRSVISMMSVLAFVCLSGYLISCWWMWSYGGSYGHRAFIDLFPALTILLGFALSGMPSVLASSVIAFTFLVFVPLNLFQIWQFNNGILPGDHLSWAGYKTIFLQTNEQLKGQFPKAPEIPRSAYAECQHFPLDGTGVMAKDRLHRFEESLAAFIPAESEYGPAVEPTLGSFEMDSANTISIYCDVLSVKERTRAIMVLTVTDSAHELINWQARPIATELYQTDRWVTTIFQFEFPMIYRPNDIVKVYAMKTEGPPLYYRDLEICLGVSD